MPMADSISWGSAWLADHLFVESFEACRYPNEKFKHLDHVRLGWIYLRTYEYSDAERRMAESIYRFAYSLGAARKYHATATIAWMRLIAGAVRITPHLIYFGEFITAHRWLESRKALLAYYSKDVISSDLARASWVEPDLRPLP